MEILGKLKELDEKVQNILIQQARTQSHIESETGTMLRMEKDIQKNISNISDLVKKHEHSIYGNGREGIVTALARTENEIEENKKFRSTVNKSLWGLVAGFIMIVVREFMEMR